MNFNRSNQLPASKNESKKKITPTKKTNLSQANAFGVETADDGLKRISATNSIWSNFFYTITINPLAMNFNRSNQLPASKNELKKKNSHPRKRQICRKQTPSAWEPPMMA